VIRSANKLNNIIFIPILHRPLFQWYAMDLGDLKNIYYHIVLDTPLIYPEDIWDIMLMFGLEEWE